MDYTITCAGIPIAVASIEPLAGLCHATVRPLPGYETVRELAVLAGEELGRGRRLWSAVDGDFAEIFARTWIGGRLAIVDPLGAELGVASVMLVHRLHGLSGPPSVIVDARPDMARVEAFLRSIDSDPGGRSRPAA